MSAPTPVRSTPATQAGTGSPAAVPSLRGSAPTPSRRPGTPRSIRRLRRLRVAAVAVLLAFGAFVLTALGISLSAAASADETLTQYYRLADARVQALEVQRSANTWALTPTAALRAELDQRLGTLATTLADAAGVNADRDRLLPLSGSLVSYGMSLQNALNANGEAAAVILAKADAQLTNELITPLQDAKAAAGDRLVANLTGNWLLWVLGAALLAAVALVAILVALAKASHRYLNLGVAAGLLCALLSATVFALLASGAASVATEFTGTDRARLDAVTMAQQQVAQARADELLSIGLKSAGSRYQQRWTTGYNAAKDALEEVPNAAAATTRLGQYNASHTTVVTELKAADWSGAATKALAAGSESGAFSAVDAALTSLAATTRSPVTTSVAGIRSSTIGGITGVVLLTLAGAGLAYWGVARRLEEYR